MVWGNSLYCPHPAIDIYSCTLQGLYLHVLVSGLGLTTILLAYLRRVTQRRAWRLFKKSVDDWVDRLVESGYRDANELSADEWKAACERMLTDANFSPLEIKEVLDVAVVVAKGIAAEKFFM